MKRKEKFRYPLSLGLVVALIAVIFSGCNTAGDIETLQAENTSLQESLQAVQENNEALTDEINNLTEEIDELSESLPKLKEGYVNIAVADNGDRSEVVFNESGTKFAYIDAVGFETVGNICVGDVETGLEVTVTRFDYANQNTAKDLIWISDHEIMYIGGYAMGTVTVGGSVYVVDIDTHDSKRIIQPVSDIEIARIEEGLSWRSEFSFVCAQWDENFTDYELFMAEYSMQDIRNLIDNDDEVTLRSDSYISELAVETSMFDQYDYIRLIKETDEGLIIGCYGYGHIDDVIVLLDRDSYKAIEREDFESDEYIPNRFKVVDGGILVKETSKIIEYNDALEVVARHKLPDEVSESVDYMLSDGYSAFWGYDVTSDLSKYVYSDGEGLKLLDGWVKTIVPGEEVEANNFVRGYFALNPQFVGEDDHVFAMASGYEGYNGWYYYNRLTGEMNSESYGSDVNFAIGVNGSSLMYICPVYPDGYGGAFMMDLNDGSLHRVEGEYFENDGYIIGNELYFTTDEKSYALSYDNGNSINLVVRNDLGEIEFMTEIIKSGRFERLGIVGVLENGHLLMHGGVDVSELYEVELVEGKYRKVSLDEPDDLIFLPVEPMKRIYSGGFENSGETVTSYGIKDNYCLVVRENTGARSVFIYEVGTQFIRLVYFVEDEENFTPEIINDFEVNRDEVVFPINIDLGTSWSDKSGIIYTVTNVDKKITTEVGVFSAYEIEQSNDGGVFGYSYYVQGIGLVKSEVYGMKSELISMESI